jgi:hypothetical protein
LAYNGANPADNEFIAAAPAELRENFRALKDDRLVNSDRLQDMSPGNANGNIPISNGTMCVNLNAEKLGGQAAAYYAVSGHVHSAATGSSNGFMSNTHFTKVEGIAVGAEVNQNAFSNILVGATTIQADLKTDTLELAAGANIALTPDAANDRVTIAVTGKVPSAAAADTATSATSATTATNAGNADTVDNLHAAQFMRADQDGVTTGDIVLSTQGKGVKLKDEVSGTVWHLHSEGDRLRITAGATEYIIPINDDIPTSLPANGGNSTTVGGYAPGTGANNVLVLDGTGKVPLANLIDSTKAGAIGFCYRLPDDNQLSNTFRLPCDITATSYWLDADAFPAADTVLYIYYDAGSGEQALCNATLTTAAKRVTANISPAVNLNAGTIMWAKVNGVANGLNMVTFEVTVVKR